MAIREDQVAKGDVLLSLGKSELSDVIKLFTGGMHSHAALYNGDEVLEATLPLTQSIPFRDFAEKSARISVMRHRLLLEESKARRDEVIDNARVYMKRKYNSTSLIITGAISTLTAWIHGNSEWLALNTNFQLSQARPLLETLHTVFRAGAAERPEGVTCTELVARAHLQAELEIDVRLDPAGSMDYGRLVQAIREVQRRSDVPLTTAQGPLSDEAVMRTVEESVRHVSEVSDEIGTFAPPSPTQQAPVHVLKALVLPVRERWQDDAWYVGLVTPAQLARSPSFKPIGRVVPSAWAIERDEELERFNRA